MHPDAVSMCPGLEHHFRVADETLFDEYTLQVQATERRRRALFAIRVELRDLAFGREPKRRGPGQLAQPVELNCVMCRKDRQDDFLLRDADDGFGPGASTYVRDGGGMHSGERRRMPKGRIGNPGFTEELVEGSRSHGAGPPRRAV